MPIKVSTTTPNIKLGPAATVGPVRQQGSSYRQILKSSAVVGGASVITIILGIMRTKALALLLGPSGVGLIGLYSSICELAQSIAGMGLKSSGVRQIAESVASGDALRVSRTVTTLRRLAWILGCVGALSLVALSAPISLLTFGNSTHTGGVALLSLVVFFGVVSGAQTALVQGMRRIGDLARLNVWGAIAGTVFSIPIVFWLRERGIPIFLVMVAAMGLVSSYYYARRISYERVPLPWQELSGESVALLKMGFVFMMSAMMSLGSAYLVRALVFQKLGSDAAGYYHAAWVLAGLYIGFILQAMGADFFPRLTAVAKDKEACNRMVNEQAEIGLLMAVPGILGTITFSQVVIYLFYSTGFHPAVELLRWNCLGMLLRVASWPMGYILIARGDRRLFMLVESVSSVGYVVFVWVGISLFGLLGTGIAFVSLYIFSGIMVFVVVHRLTGFNWSASCLRLGFVFAPLLAAVFLASLLLPGAWGLVIGALGTLVGGIYSLRVLSKAIPFERMPPLVKKVMAFLKLTSSHRDD